ncbi:MAG: hypothetical protein NO515_05340 [Candidatus Methanomethylicia archaeon]|jgi:hypothetical protein|nr:hypothetical protein [Candidatus Methanomethylicia archaeon]
MSEVKNALVKEVMRNISLGGKEEAIARAVAELTDAEKIELLSNLYPFEDEELSLIQLIGERYDVDFLKEYVQTKLKLRCSVMGWRANQIAAIASEAKKQRVSLLTRLFGKRKAKDQGDLENIE